MLFRQDVLQGIAEGRVSLAFRRWRKNAPANGSTLRTSLGVLSLDRVAVIDEGDITADDILRTGLSTTALQSSIEGEGTLLRIEVRLVGDDPRVALREQVPSPDELDSDIARLHRLDAATAAPWTRRCLQLIADQPAIVSRVLAAQVDCELPVFKRRIRQLKELGLTQSFEVGYRLSPRGEQVLRHFDTHASLGQRRAGRPPSAERTEST